MYISGTIFIFFALWLTFYSDRLVFINHPKLRDFSKFGTPDRWGAGLQAEYETIIYPYIRDGLLLLLIAVTDFFLLPYLMLKLISDKY